MGLLFHSKKPLQKKIIAAALAAAVTLAGVGVTSVYTVSGQSIKDHQDLKDKAEQDLKDINEQIDQNQADQDNLSDKIDQNEQKADDLETEIATYQKKQRKLESKIATKTEELAGVVQKLEGLATDIENKQNEISIATDDLEAAQDRLDEEYASMKVRIQYMYENSTEDSFWTAILDSKGLLDMLNRVEYIADVYESDRMLMQQYQDTVQEVENLNIKLATEMEELLALEQQAQEEQNSIETRLAELEEDRKELNDTVAYLEKKQAKLENTLATLEKQQKDYETQLARLTTTKSNLESTISKEAEIIRKLEAAAARQNANSYEGGGTGKENSFGSAAYLTDDSYNPDPATNVSGNDIVKFAEQYVGNPYRWGGNSLTQGADCSGFVRLGFQHFGIDTPRYSQSFKTVGQPVSFNNMKPGDVVVYDGHVAIYKGNGLIVEAQSTKAGITNNRKVTCHKITAIRRIY